MPFRKLKAYEFSNKFRKKYNKTENFTSIALKINTAESDYDDDKDFNFYQQDAHRSFIFESKGVYAYEDKNMTQLQSFDSDTSLKNAIMKFASQGSGNIFHAISADLNSTIAESNQLLQFTSDLKPTHIQEISETNNPCLTTLNIKNDNDEASKSGKRIAPTPEEIHNGSYDDGVYNYFHPIKHNILHQEIIGWCSIINTENIEPTSPEKFFLSCMLEYKIKKKTSGNSFFDKQSTITVTCTHLKIKTENKENLRLLKQADPSSRKCCCCC